MSLGAILKWAISQVPESRQMDLRRIRYRWLIRRGHFGAGEPEFEKIEDWVEPGDWVIDVGANIGTYTMALSRLVGPEGRVIALEPFPPTFQLLTLHVGGLRGGNVTLLNLAASERSSSVRMDVPLLESGLDNIYQSSISTHGKIRVLAIPLDALSLDARIRLIKIDVEGHELSVLRGAMQLIRRCLPILILEGDLEEFADILVPLGYSRRRFKGSPNTVYLPSPQSA